MSKDFLIEEKPLITIKEARKILGSRYTGLSDKEIENKIASLTRLAKILFKNLNRQRDSPTK